MNARRLLVAVVLAFAGWTTLPAATPTTSNGPALAAYDGRLYLAFSSADRERRIHVARVGRDGKIHRSTRLSSRTSRTPALAEYQGRLWMAFRSADRSGHIYLQSYDGKAWSRARKLRHTTASGPALVEHDGRLHLVWRGSGDDSMYHASFDGRRWSDTEKIRLSKNRGTNVEKAPAIASLHGSLYALYNSRGEAIWIASSNGGAWDVGPGDDGAVRLWDSKRAPALTRDGRNLFAAVVSPGGSVLLRRHRFGAGWKPLADPDVRTGRRVGIAALGDTLYLAYTRRDGNGILIRRVDLDR